MPIRPESDHEWLSLTDFSAGVYDHSYVSTAQAIVPYPKVGAADAEATFCCCALPGGGLGPLPALTTVYNLPSAIPGTVATLYVVGFTLNPGSALPEIVYMVEGDDGTNHYFQAWSDVIGGALTNILNKSSATVAGFFGAPYPTWTRMQHAAAGTIFVVCAFPSAVSTDPNGNSGHLYVYPAPTAPGAFGAADLITPGSSVTGQIVGYQGRLLAFAGIPYTYPAGNISVNEEINYTDPSQDDVFGNQQAILVPENPWGYTCAASVSEGELFMVKKQGGGVILFGDVNNPGQVVPLPGVQRGGDFWGRAEGCDLGVVYCSEQQGAWAWSGGNVAEKISGQLRDSFYDCSSGVIASNNFGFFVKKWGDYLVFSNNYLYNTLTKSWWVLYPNANNGTGSVPGRTLYHYADGVFGNQLYAARLSLTAANKEMAYLFDSKVGAPHWQWKSLPINLVPNRDHVVDVREIVLRVSCPDTGASVSVNVTSTSGSATFNPTTTINPTPTTIPLNVGLQGLFDFTVQVNGDNATAGHSGPILHSLDIGYNIAANIAKAN